MLQSSLVDAVRRLVKEGKREIERESEGETPAKPHNRWRGHVPGGFDHPSCPDEEDSQRKRHSGAKDGCKEQ